jgi:hypothetical protein
MSNIFNFRPGKKRSPDSDFLKDADDTVEFVHNGKGVSLGDAPQHFLQDPVSEVYDWTNQELANIYRVKQLLDAAGVPNELERGISDEGDPWCIFCKHDGDVFIHLCRIDLRYVLDSPNLRAPIYGDSFSELIEEFSGGALQNTPARMAAKGGSRVIKLERNGKVFLHPAALLAALIWSIYLNSEDLVMYVPEDDALAGGEGDDNIALINETALAPLTDSDAASAAQFLDTTALPDQVVGARMGETVVVRDGMAFKDIVSKTAMFATPSQIAVGLSSIAVAFGIMSEGFFDDPTGQEIAAATDLTVEATAIEIADLEQQEQDTAARSPHFDLVAVLQSVFDHGPVPEQVLPSALSVEIAGMVDLSAVLSSMLPQPEQTDVAINLAGTFQDSWANDAQDEAHLATEVREKKASKSAEKTTEDATRKAETKVEVADVVIASSTAGSETPFEIASLLDLKAAMVDAFQTFDFGGEMVEATFDIATLSPITSTLLNPLPVADIPVTTITQVEKIAAPNVSLSEPETIDLAVIDTSAPAPITPTTFNLIDLNARAFIEYLMSRGDGVEMISRPSEFVLLDFDALESGQDTHSMGWALDDGNTVFTIGLKSDFIEYDLIA